MGKHSTNEPRGKPWIAAAGPLILAAVVAITLTSGVHKPANTAIGGGGNTGNQISVE